FASNDYLGLSVHPALAAAAKEAIDRWGTGSTASRLIVGTRPGHAAIEADLAQWKQCEAALVFSSGFAANVGVLGSLGGVGVTVFSDALNHASIIDGCRLSRSELAVYRHGDVAHLRSLLAAATGRKIVVTDTVFSMDGDVAPIGELVNACAEHGALLVLDEAHAVLGPELTRTCPAGVVRVGTLSKTLGSLGGFVAATSPMVELLVNRARSLIFTTALSPADVAAGRAGLAIVRSAEGDALRARLRANIDRLRPGHRSPIVPIVIGDEAAAMAISARLQERGVLVPAIRPPTVPVGSSRLRIALSSAHTAEMMDLLQEQLGDVGLLDGDGFIDQRWTTIA
ncbi:MAG: aminotransferase class I/II-fold pyridoxal phosphate-dependent enzyme, partial [Acidimicrobiia bacterium]